MTTLPLKKNAASRNPKKTAEFLEFYASKRFGEGVRYHVFSRTVEQGDVTMRNSLMNKMEMDVDVFGATVKSRVLR